MSSGLTFTHACPAHLSQCAGLSLWVGLFVFLNLFSNFSCYLAELLGAMSVIDKAIVITVI